MKKPLNLIILPVLLILAACGSKQPAEAVEAEAKNTSLVQLTDAQIKTAGVETAKLQQRPVSEVLLVNGKLDVPPQGLVSVSVPLGGYLKHTALLPGMEVKKGQVLATMEDQQYIELQQDYLTAKAKLEFLEHEYKRQQELNQSKASSDKVYQQTKADYQSQRVLVKALSEKLRLLGLHPGRLSESNLSRSIQVYSPIHGFVSEVFVNPGKYVVPSDVLFELIDPSDIHVNLTVFEKDVDKLHIGQKVIARSASNPEKVYPCEIIYISRDIAPDRTVEVHCHLQEQDKTLVPGTFVNAEIEVQRQDALVLPEDAVVQFENKEFVFASRGSGTYEMVQAPTGITENGYTELNLPPGSKLRDEDFVTKGAYTLLMKLKNTSEEE
ncbi:MAG: efflux RND transporter periplasmic adaptor subunit [Pontibacter sp.]|nr:efflux RND transporter periplasmic adaptor subunit [Pontibacter sp.]